MKHKLLTASEVVENYQDWAIANRREVNCLDSFLYYWLARKSFTEGTGQEIDSSEDEPLFIKVMEQVCE